MNKKTQKKINELVEKIEEELVDLSYTYEDEDVYGYLKEYVDPEKSRAIKKSILEIVSEIVEEVQKDKTWLLKTVEEYLKTMDDKHFDERYMTDFGFASDELERFLMYLRLNRISVLKAIEKKK